MDNDESDFTHVYGNQIKVCVCLRAPVCWGESEILRLGKKVMAVHKQVTNEAPD